MSGSCCVRSSQRFGHVISCLNIDKNGGCRHDCGDGCDVADAAPPGITTRFTDM